MSFERRVVGLIALGAKQSGRFFSGEDLALLRTLANQGAVAVQNAQSYHTLKRVNQELRDAQSRLIEAERFAAIGELSALVAHGIRNPLAGIKAAAQYAELDLPSDHPLHENIADIITEVDKLEGRIKALLDFARPFEPHPAPCDVGQIVRDALASLRTQITAQGITVATEIDPALPQAQLDYAQIEQVLLALMSNAIEAMPRGGRLGVSVGARPTTRAGCASRSPTADRVSRPISSRTSSISSSPASRAAPASGSPSPRRSSSCTAAASAPRARWPSAAASSSSCRCRPAAAPRGRCRRRAGRAAREAADGTRRSARAVPGDETTAAARRCGCARPCRGSRDVGGVRVRVRRCGRSEDRRARRPHWT